ncbi:sensor histidine kinase [Niveibacterium terrae]|uniref:sensor histidine kinase n=1 Tax=Niveibacterium terrae TaxID=3373598 RepID=UPI003A8F0070
MNSAAPAYYDTTRPVWRTALRELPAVLAINTLVGFFCAAYLPAWERIGEIMITSHCIGLGISSAILALRVACTRLCVRGNITIAVLALIGIPSGFLLGGTVSSLFKANHSLLLLGEVSLPAQLRSLGFSILGGTLGILYFFRKAQLIEARQREELAKRAVLEAQLRSLQAQIEPHFLFNTLANLDALIGLDPKQARVLLGHLNRFLRNSLTHARSTQCTLGEECEQLRAYLSIMEIRLPDRFSASVLCPPEYAELPFAPMLLQPLVENAIKHGIEPSASGGNITVAVRSEGQTLTIDVSDNGVGLDKAPFNETSTGTGLANVRERLAMLYGDETSLELRAREPSGTAAQLRIPFAALEDKA